MQFTSSNSIIDRLDWVWDCKCPVAACEGDNVMNKGAIRAGASAVMAVALALPAFDVTHAEVDASQLQKSFPKLVRYLNFTEILQLSVYEEIVATNESEEFAIGKVLMREQVTELQKTEESHYHSAGNHLATLSPYRVFESRAMPGLLAMIRRQDGLIRSPCFLCLPCFSLVASCRFASLRPATPTWCANACDSIGRSVCA